MVSVLYQDPSIVRHLRAFPGQAWPAIGPHIGFQPVGIAPVRAAGFGGIGLQKVGLDFGVYVSSPKYFLLKKFTKNMM